MQVLKESVKQRIVSSARKEFKKKGYDKASMREITSAAGMTVGNLYRYYKNKEDLFGSIIEVLTSSLNGLDKEMEAVEGDKVNWLLEKIRKLQKEYKTEWLIMSEGSAGSRYEQSLDNVLELLEKVIKDLLIQQNKDPRLAAPMASAMLHGLGNILQNEKKNFWEVSGIFLQYMLSGIG